MSRKHAVMAVFLWSTVASAFKLSLRYMSPLQLMFYASLTSFVLFGTIRGFHKPKRRDLHSAYLGLIDPLLYYTVLFSAYNLLPAQEAQALNYTWPLVLVLLSIPLFGRRPNGRVLAGLSVGFLGALVVATKGHLLSLHFSNTLGDLLGLGSAVIWATYWLLNLRDDRPLAEKMFWNFFFGLLYVSVLMAVRGALVIPPLAGLVGAVYVGLFEMGVTYFVWYRAVEGDMEFASNLAYLVPFLSLVFISVVVGERIAPATVVGLTMIVGGILLGKG